MRIAAFLHQIRRGHAERRHRRQARRDLRNELSVYTSQTDVDDLLAAFDGHDGSEVEEMRSILREQVLRRQHHAALLFAS